MASESLKPLIKWAGGKRQLLSELEVLMPDKFNMYFEPFIGGGALFLHVAPEDAVINDFNPLLTKMYQVVKKNKEELIRQLAIYQEKNSKDYYLDVRLMDRDGRTDLMSDVELVARFMYLNKTGFNGLWRVNKKGQNNVPFANYKNPKILNSEIIDKVSMYLNNTNIKILNGDYKKAIETAKMGDFVYFDPPYAPINMTSSFTSYTESDFGLIEQTQLRDTFKELTKKNVKVMLSNSDVPLIHDLYDDLEYARIHVVKASRFINSKSSGRGKINELVITNY